MRFPKRLAAIEENAPLIGEEVGIWLMEAHARIVCCVLDDPRLAFVRESLREIAHLVAADRPAVDVVEASIV